MLKCSNILYINLSQNKHNSFVVYIFIVSQTFGDLKLSLKQTIYSKQKDNLRSWCRAKTAWVTFKIIL